MSEVVTTQKDAEIGVITVDSPPVNALGVKVRQGIDRALRELGDADDVRAIVLICGGRTFFAGADISEFGQPHAPPFLSNLFIQMETLGKPVIAAIHGTALGGGLEVALACNYRVAVPSARLGLPEVNLGLLPGAGGTQRLPRLVGAELALDLILTGRQITAPEGERLGVIDQIVEEGKLLEGAVAFARAKLAAGGPVVSVRDRQDKIGSPAETAAFFETYRAKNASKLRKSKAATNIVGAVEAATQLPFDQGLVRESELFQELVVSPESAAQRYYFFAEREAAKIPDIPSSTPTIPIRSAGVIGAGTMGGGITMNFLNAGIPVKLVEINQEALDRGIGVIRANYERSAKKRGLPQSYIDDRIALITPSLDLQSLADVDLVIEAALEQMALKKELFEKLGKIVRPDAILASNTSYLNIDEIASVTPHPELVLGLHFFSPANVMRLLEIVRGAKTKPEVIATALQLAKKLSKVPVVSRVCHGFIANRVMNPRRREADALILEGTTPWAIDDAMSEFGFAMGPFSMMDLVGLDVIGRDAQDRTVLGDLVAAGRRGQKGGGGYYDYDASRVATPSPVAAKIIADVASAKGVAASPPLSDEAIIERLLFPIVNEGAKILEEGIAERASDIDVACILGYSWPVGTGGPMYWADSVGLPKVVAALERLAERYGPEYLPAKLLKEKAAAGANFTK